MNKDSVSLYHTNALPPLVPVVVDIQVLECMGIYLLHMIIVQDRELL